MLHWLDLFTIVSFVSVAGLGVGLGFVVGFHNRPKPTGRRAKGRSDAQVPVE